MVTDVLRFTTAGSVDDGKSTLIGRLLLDSKAILEDQMAAMERASAQRGDPYLDLALITDGLRAEREQGITIDVAYRYFSTPRRKFIIADTPGHIQYTRNMVTGASTAELAIILIDARKGVVTQSKRHGFLASLLQIPHLLVAVNKMDLVDYREDMFRTIMDEYRGFASKLTIQDMTFIPISALAGDNVVNPSSNMPWYDGSSLLHYLEHVNVSARRNLVDFRFPVQMALRPNQDLRGFAGQITSGTISPGEEIIALPSGKTSKIRSILTSKGELQEASAGDSVMITLEDEIDISRGDMLVRRQNVPRVTGRFDAMLCWMAEEPLNPNRAYILQHTTRQAQVQVKEITYRVDVDTLHRQPAPTLQLNEIGRVELMTSKPIFCDPYQLNRGTGGFILIDPTTNNTVAAGMIRNQGQDLQNLAGTTVARSRSSNVVWESSPITRPMREERNGHEAAVLWFTGLSASGKSTLASLLEQRLFSLGVQTFRLDGDNVRHGLNGDLGFSEDDRKENIRRVAEVAKLAFDHGAIVICTFISPLARDRQFARSLLPQDRFIEIYTRCDVEVCKQRDPKGLYVKAQRGEIRDFTGVSAPYEEPEHPDVLVETDKRSVEDILDQLLDELSLRGILGAPAQ